MDAKTTPRLDAATGECRRVRERLCAAPVPASQQAAASLAAHLASCPQCAAFARRLELVRQALARPMSPSLPPSPSSPSQDMAGDPRFPARVLARIERPVELIGWAAFRALPAALGLALALALLGLSSSPPPPSSDSAEPAVPAALAGPAPAAQPSPLLDGPPSSDQLLAWSSLSPEVWP